MKKIGFVINSKHLKDCVFLQNYINKLKQNFEISVYYTEKHGDGVSLSQKATEENCDLIFSVGGDGTVFEVVNGIIKSQNKNIIFYPLKCGSSNDFTKTLKEICNYKNFPNLYNTKIKEIDVGKIYFPLENKFLYFVNILDVGLGSKTVEKTKNPRKFISSKITYTIHSFSVMLNFKYPKIKLKAETEKNIFEYEGQITDLIIANAKYFGNGLKISPLSVIDDGFLDLVLVKKVSLLKFVNNLPNIRKGKTLEHLDVKYLKIKKITVIPVDGTFPVEAEGELIGKLPFEAEVLPGRLKILCF